MTITHLEMLSSLQTAKHTNGSFSACKTKRDVSSAKEHDALRRQNAWKALAIREFLGALNNAFEELIFST